jgi:hypothetical protein
MLYSIIFHHFIALSYLQIKLPVFCSILNTVMLSTSTIRVKVSDQIVHSCNILLAPLLLPPAYNFSHIFSIVYCNKLSTKKIDIIKEKSKNFFKFHSLKKKSVEIDSVKFLLDLIINFVKLEN